MIRDRTFRNSGKRNGLVEGNVGLEALIQRLLSVLSSRLEGFMREQ